MIAKVEWNEHFRIQVKVGIITKNQGVVGKYILSLDSLVSKLDSVLVVVMTRVLYKWVDCIESEIIKYYEFK